LSSVSLLLYDQDFHGKNIAEITSALIGTKAALRNLPPLESSILPALASSNGEGQVSRLV
jgi:cytochrome c biogenesis protein CcmG/thiol:disulfide interchange protein DsbE